jgi:hypothetical protein
MDDGLYVYRQDRSSKMGQALVHRKLRLLIIFLNWLASEGFTTSTSDHKTARVVSHDEYEQPSTSSAVDLMTANLPDPVMARSSFFALAAALMTAPATAEAASTTMSTSTAEATTLQESISGFVAGAALTGTKTLVKFPLDTATVRLQMPNSKFSLQDTSRLFRGSYNGVTLSLFSNIPGGAIFFAVKDATKAALRHSAMSTLPTWATTSLAVAAAQFPYWLVRNPSEVIKVRQQAGIEGYGEGISAWEAVQTTLRKADASGNGTSSASGLQEFYTGRFYVRVQVTPLVKPLMRLLVFSLLRSFKVIGRILCMRTPRM